MYIPKHHEETDPAVLHALMRAHPLGTWVTLANGEPVANHIPFLLDTARGEFGTLIGHVARANPVWEQPTPSLVIFHGDDAYITPSWYPAKREHGKVVPTWNYAVVHARGLPRIIEDKNWLLAHVSALTKTHEAAQARPWSVSDAPKDFIDALLNAIVGIEIPIRELAGKWKVSQNRSEADKLGVVAGLSAQGDDDMAAMVGRFAAAKRGVT